MGAIGVGFMLSRLPKGAEAEAFCGGPAKPRDLRVLSLDRNLQSKAVKSEREKLLYQRI